MGEQIVALWAPFKLFARQADALKFMSDAGEDFRVFSREIGLNGSRVLEVFPSVDHFWETYREKVAIDKTYNEVIPMGRAAKLYFDLEFFTDLNPVSDGQRMTEILLDFVKYAVLQDFPAADVIDVLVLDSSTTTKFSRHIIFPSLVFHDLRQMKIFIHRLQKYIKNIIQQDTSESNPYKLPSNLSLEDMKTLLINKQSETGISQTLFMDVYVYGDNQNFRLYQSSKYGKNNPFLRLRGSMIDKSDKTVFLGSVITNVQLAPEAWLKYADTEEFRLSTSAPRPKKNFVQTGQCPSPYPALDLFVTDLITENGRKGEIKVWKYEADAGTLRFFIQGDFRYCDNIGDHHEDYAVFFIIELKRRVYRLRCLSPDCALYNARKIPVPYHIHF